MNHLYCFFHVWLLMAGNLLNSVFRFLERWDNLPSGIQAVGIALLTVFIPLAIATLENVHRNAEFVKLDLNVVLDKVFGIKQILLYVGFIFLPTLFWGISGGEVRLFEFALAFTGISLMVKSLLGVYHWVKGDVFEFRFSYLEDLKNHKDLEAVWRSVWEAKNINLQNEREFFQIFSSTIDELIKDHESKS